MRQKRHHLEHAGALGDLTAPAMYVCKPRPVSPTSAKWILRSSAPARQKPSDS